MSAEIAIAHEAAAIRAFVIRDKQARFLSFVANPKTRGKFVLELANFGWFDRRFATAVPWKTDPTLKLWDRHVQGIARISQLLKSNGAGQELLGDFPKCDLGRERIGLG